MSAHDAWERRVALTEVNGRRVNESLQRGGGDDGDGGTAVVVCECGKLGCTTTLELPAAEYEHVRSSFDRFLVAAGHELPDVEEVVERRSGYLVVAKQGAGAEIAARHDPRAENR